MNKWVVLHGERAYWVTAEELAWSNSGHMIFVNKQRVHSEGKQDRNIVASFPPNLPLIVLSEENFNENFAQHSDDEPQPIGV